MKSFFSASKINSWRNAIRLHHAVGFGMIGTGLLYHTYLQGSIPAVLFDMLGFWGFWMWSAVMVICGVGLMVRPQYVVWWMMPYLVLMMAVAILVIRQETFTAFIYYSQLYIFTLYFSDYRQREFSINALQIAGCFQFLMGIVLILHPQGSGLDLLYAGIRPFLFGVIEPDVFYQLFYLCTGVVLFPKGKINKHLAQGLTSPFLMHGIFFIFIGVNLGIWAFVPMFVAISLVFVHIGGIEYD